MEIIPQRVLKYLTFRSEPMVEWDEKTDLLQFLYGLHEKTGEILSQDGKRTLADYRFYGRVVHDRGLRDFEIWAGKARA